MKRFIFAFLLAVLAPGVWAAATYTYTGPTYASAAIINYTPACGGGDCQNYLTTMRIAGSFTTAVPLAPNLAAADIRAQLTSWSFSDGLKTIASTDPNARLFQFQVHTDPGGNITGSTISLQLWQTGSAPHAVNDRYGDIAVLTGSGVANHNATCLGVGVPPAGDADSCTMGTGFPAETSSAYLSVPGTWAFMLEPNHVPTLSAWGVVALGALLGLAGFSTRRRG
ncbi:MAG: IPTL-CTERM sorting domain-containing protein [Chromatiales bacterium]|nr:IPTL-CTERM sorting domain-containing protein [Chromatiales bacterium]